MHLPADAQCSHEVLDVEQPARAAVDPVLGPALPLQTPRHLNLAGIDGHPALRIVEDQAYLGDGAGAATVRAGEYDVLHAAAPEVAGTLLSQHP